MAPEERARAARSEASAPEPSHIAHDEPGEYSPEAALDAYYAQREYELGGGREDAIAAAALDAQPEAKVVEFADQGERFFAVRTSPDEFAVRHETEYDPAEFRVMEQPPALAQLAADEPEVD
jgi:hypothetical protein